MLGERVGEKCSPPPYYPALPAQETEAPTRIAVRAVEPRRFDGSGQMSGEEWLDIVAAAALANGWPKDESLVVRAVPYLDGAAFKAYQGLVRARQNNPAGANSRRQSYAAFGRDYEAVNWTEFADHIKTCFPGSATGCAAIDKLIDRKQGSGESFVAYAHDKMELCSKLDPAMNEKAKVDWVVSGALPSMKIFLQQAEVNSLKELLEKGVKFSEVSAATNSKMAELVNAMVAQVEATGSSTRDRNGARGRQGRNINCFACGKPGHRASECRSKPPPSQFSNGRGRGVYYNRNSQQNNSGRFAGNTRGNRNFQNGPPRTSVCYRCQTPGHFARECPGNVSQRRLN